MKILFVDKMGEVDKKTAKEYGIPGTVLMENAGKAVAERAIFMAGDLDAREVLIICGKGNNGGDGFACARYLEKAGLNVKTFLLGRRRDIRGDAKTHMEASFKNTTLTEISSSSISKLKNALAEADIVIDAILGTGAKGPLKSPIADAVELINNSNKHVISVDIPSGLDPDNGTAASVCVNSDLTVTMGCLKLGLLLNEGPDRAGEVITADIGIPAELLEEISPDAELLTIEEAASLLPVRPKNSHKGSMGRVCVLAGSVGHTGAAMLASGAAIRSGCGMVFLGSPRTVNPTLESALPEIITKPLPETESITLGLDAEEHISEMLESSDALAIGPGLGKHPETAALVKKIILTSQRPMVIDADAINSLKDDPSVLGNRQAEAVLTPHPGELAALTGKSIEELMLNPAEILRSLAKKFNAVFVLKTAKTLIAAPDGGLFINSTGNPGMATAGSGDVLTGMIASFIARGLTAAEAAKLGVFLHGLAGDIAAEEMTEEAMIAGDILNSLPEAFEELSGC